MPAARQHPHATPIHNRLPAAASRSPRKDVPHRASVSPSPEIESSRSLTEASPSAAYRPPSGVLHAVLSAVKPADPAPAQPAQPSVRHSVCHFTPHSTDPWDFSPACLRFHKSTLLTLMHFSMSMLPASRKITFATESHSTATSGTIKKSSLPHIKADKRTIPIHHLRLSV